TATRTAALTVDQAALITERPASTTVAAELGAAPPRTIHSIAADPACTTSSGSRRRFAPRNWRRQLPLIVTRTLTLAPSREARRASAAATLAGAIPSTTSPRPVSRIQTRFTRTTSQTLSTVSLNRSTQAGISAGPREG